MTFLIALALGILLAHRLGAFQPMEEYHAQIDFTSQVYQLAEDVEWEERMARYSRQLTRVRRLPYIQFKQGRS